MNWQDAWLESFDNPLLFAEGVLGISTLEPWQKEALKAMGVESRVAVRSGHGVGKTFLEAIIALWWLCTRKPSKTLITANSEAQLRDVTWAEIVMLSRRLPKEIRDRYEWGVERIQLLAEPESCFASRRTASVERPEALQGFHSEYTLVIAEEASGIHESLFPVMLGALSTPGSKMLLAGNPTRGNGYFFDAFHRLAHRFYCMRVSSEDVPRARAHIEDVIARFGKDSNTYRVRVEGEFPSQDDETVIPLHLCQAAVNRDIVPAKGVPVVWGLDVSRFGDDACALAKRQGPTLLEPVREWKNRELTETAGMVVDEFRKVEQSNPQLVPVAIMVDVIGLGAGVYARLREVGMPARAVNVTETPSAKARFHRLRDELWFTAREWLEERGCKLADDQQLIAELTAPTYKFDSNGKLWVESKDDMKKRGLKSPNKADAFLMTFAGGYDRPKSKFEQPSTAWVV